MISRPTLPASEPRPTCPRCFRPKSGCFCADLEPIRTQTRVVILQHPRERYVGIGTVRLARAGLADAELRRGVDFGEDPVVCAAAASGNAYLLFPGDHAIDVETARFPSPITLVVVDGTWRQAQKMIRRNPILATLPRLRLSPRAPSLYGTIRKEPAAHCVATLEAIAHVLGYLENDHERFSALLRSMAGMVAQQTAFATQVAANRHRKAAEKRPPRDPIPPILRERLPDIVCVHGEANAWPRRHPERSAPEVVHWIARRVQTGETFEAIVAPRGTLAPSTCRHIRLSSETLAAGVSLADFRAKWSAFLRPNDVLVAWGMFSLGALAAEGVPVDHPHFDARTLASRVLKRRPGTLDACLTAMHLTVPAALGEGRCGERAASVCAVVEALARWTTPPRST